MCLAQRRLHGLRITVAKPQLCDSKQRSYTWWGIDIESILETCRNYYYVRIRLHIGFSKSLYSSWNNSGVSLLRTLHCSSVIPPGNLRINGQLDIILFVNGVSVSVGSHWQGEWRPPPVVNLFNTLPEEWHHTETSDKMPQNCWSANTSHNLQTQAQPAAKYPLSQAILYQDKGAPRWPPATMQHGTVITYWTN